MLKWDLDVQQTDLQQRVFNVLSQNPDQYILKSSCFAQTLGVTKYVFLVTLFWVVQAEHTCSNNPPVSSLISALE
jgi:hypothetical protein